jgi:hypothetical protein
MDNFNKNCPAMMSDGRLFTDYRTPHRREQYNKTINGIVRDDDYRMFLQNNAEDIMDRTWEHAKQTSSCTQNVCIHTYPTRTTPGYNYEEMRLYNAVRTGKGLKKVPLCKKLSDYRMSVTKGGTQN